MLIWFKAVRDSRIVRSTTIEDSSGETRTHKIFGALEQLCNSWDLAVPVWLDANVKDFKEHSKCRFGRDSFIEEVPFDFLEMQVLEEDPDAQ